MNLRIRMAHRLIVRRYSSAPFLTTERYPDVRRGSYGNLGDAQVAAFERILGANRVLTCREDVAPYNIDWFKTVCGQGKVVLRPKNTEEMSHVMKICSENRLAVCPQGGNTGLVGGSVPVFDEVVISTSLMNQVNFVDGISGTVSCQAGVVLEKLEKALKPEGLMAPYDLGARGSCQVGGNISTCAGGLRLLRYGSMLANTLGIEALFVGSEGTLGIVTQAVLQCPIYPRSINLAFLTLKNFSDVLSTFALAKRNLCETLSSCEMMDSASMWYLENKLDLKVPLEHDSNTFFMFIETHGSREDHDEEKLSGFVQDAMDKGFVLDGITTNEPARMTNLWQLRERAAEASSKEDYLYTYDVTLPLRNFYDAVGVLKQRIAPFRDAKVSGFGHLGDGNLHLDVTSPSYSGRLLNAIEPFIFEWVMSVGGSISAEHGMGFKKAKFLKYAKSPEAIDLMRRLKSSMDPLGILNPYKVLPPL
ncbi:hypothetical protein GE061_008094 [Apolygus lucorum]|uniref:D-2-hydroxyglutarate dehydrogenase, mitochondrial n=1 Tax=Apolygus lucorum TaxID=248454 RepID=A0A8S9WRC1_APOLU|nr:hypothetical protein GE061_008094 [Apolygus lucorum]